MVTDGKDAWPLSITYDVLSERVNGDFSRQTGAWTARRSSPTPTLSREPPVPASSCKSGLFQDDLLISDYGASRNLFGQGKAAMYLMGSWEMGLCHRSRTSPRASGPTSDAFKFPVLKNGKGTTTSKPGSAATTSSVRRPSTRTST